MDYLLGLRHCEIKRNYLREKEQNWWERKGTKNIVPLVKKYKRIQVAGTLLTEGIILKAKICYIIWRRVEDYEKQIDY